LPTQFAGGKFPPVTFLPIVMRELRVAARKRRTFWLRVLAAFVAMFIGSAILLLSAAQAATATQLGSILFGALTWLALITAAAAGLFFTADCLSEEKREGTLGFLFLTELRGYDVAGGKLLSTSLRASYALFAVFPILAITLIMGGVTGIGFWKTTLAIINALFCSLMAGLFVSSISRESQKALGGTLLLLLVWLAAGPIADQILLVTKHGNLAFFSRSSPYYVFAMSNSWGHPPFWAALLTTQIIAWVLFLIASLVVARAWQEKRSRKSSGVSSLSYGWRYGGRGRRLRIRERLIGLNPVMWLACRERWQSFPIWVIAIVPAAAAVAAYFTGIPEITGMVLGWLTSLFVWIAYIWAASQANRFLVEARRSGMIELLLATPLTVGEILRGQWRAFGRMFGPPIGIIIAAVFFGAVLGKGASSFGPVGAMAGAAQWLLILALASLEAASVAANLIALIWFGMWMGLTSRNNSLASMKTFAFVQVIPAMLIWFASGMTMFLWFIPLMSRAGSGGAVTASFASSDFLWVALVTSGVKCALTLAKDAAFAFWARTMLHATFREAASRTPGAPRFSAPPAIAPPIIPLPPVIATRP
jgi:hypothetical protein